MPISRDQDWVRLLKESDERSLPGRVARLPLVYSDPDPDGWQLFTGGEVAMLAYEEARLAYLHGAFVGSILLVQVCLEHLLAGLFRMAGDDEMDRERYRTMLGRARDEGYLNFDEWEFFDTLRRARNPYAHSRPPASAESPSVRALDMDVSTPDLIEADARQAMTALMSLMRRAPFFTEE